MSKFDEGAQYVRDCIIGMIIGMQNDIGNAEKDKASYEAYQKVYKEIVDRFGDMYTPFKG